MSPRQSTGSPTEYEPDQVEGFQPMSEEEVKAMTIRLIANAVVHFPSAINQKAWFLMKAEPGT